MLLSYLRAYVCPVPVVKGRLLVRFLVDGRAYAPHQLTKHEVNFKPTQILGAAEGACTICVEVDSAVANLWQSIILLLLMKSGSVAAHQRCK